MKLRILTSIFLLCMHFANAQSGLRFTTIDVATGLSQNTVNAIVEDEYGLFWLATQDGLNRFDGQQFETLRADISGTALTDQFVTSLALAPNGDLWAGCRNGLNRITCGGEKIIHIPLPPDSLNSNYRTVSQIVISHDEVAALVGTRVYFFQLDASDTAKAVDAGFDAVNAICQSNGRVLLATDNALFVKQDGQFERIKTISTPEPIKGMRVQKDTLIWTDNTIHVLSDEVEVIPLNAKINDVIRHHDALWIGTENGLFIAQDGRPPAMAAYSQRSEQLLKADVHGFMVDREGALWLGTNRYGAYRWAPLSASILHLPGAMFSDPVIWCAGRTDTLLLIGSTRGLHLYAVPNDWPCRSLSPERDLRYVNRFEGFHAASIYVDGEQAFIGTRKNGVFKLDLSSASYRLQQLIAPVDEDICYHIDKISDTEYVVAMNKYIGLLSVDGLLKKVYPSDLFNNLTTDYVHHVRYSDGLIYATGTQGVFVLDSDLSPVAHFSRNDSTESLTFNVTGTTAEAANDGWWVSYFGGGVSRAHQADKPTFTHIGRDEGLRNDHVYSVIDRTPQGTWMATNEGLSVWSDNEIQNLTTDDGLPFNEHSQNAAGAFGEWLWFGGIDGMYLFRPQDVLTPKKIPLPVVTSLQINYTPRLRDSSLFAITGDPLRPTRIELGPNDRSMTMALSIPGFNVDTDEELCYRLSGITEDWVGLGRTNGRLDFTALPVGEHTLDIGVMTTGGQPMNYHRIELLVNPPYFKTLWFRLAMIALGLILAALITRFFVQRRLREEILKRRAIERVQEERQRISMELHDNIGAQITHVITSLDNLSFKVHRGGVKTPEAELDNLSDFARGTMQQLRDTIWTLSREAIDVSSFAERINDYLGRILADRETPVFTLNNEIQEPLNLNPSATIHLFRVVQEAANNTLKHAEAGQIEITLRKAKGELVLIYRDNGVGFSVQESKSEQYGLKNMRARMEEIGGQVKIESAPGAGVSITAVLPISSEGRA